MPQRGLVTPFSLRSSACLLLRHRDSLAEMRDRFLVGRTMQRLIARPSPPFNRKFVEPSFGEVTRENFGRRARVVLLIQEDFAGAAVERPAAALRQAVVGRVLDQRVLKAINCVRATGLDD